MNRINETFKNLKSKKKKAFIPYITAGDPDMQTTEKIALSLANSGADIIELGIPFSDPLADGPTIQRAIYRSLKGGCTVRKVLSLVKRLRKKTQVPLVFMTYYNIVFNYGLSKFIKDAKLAGADGIIVPDLPMEEADPLMKEAKKNDFCLVMLTAPTTPASRFKRIASFSQGFVYYVSLTGVTGARKNLSNKIKQDVKKLKRLTKKPICVGFGISRPAQAKEIAKVSDGIIVGSAIINIIEENLKSKTRIAKSVGKFSSSIARAAHNA